MAERDGGFRAGDAGGRLALSVVIPSVGRRDLVRCLDAVASCRPAAASEGACLDVIVAHDRYSETEAKRLRERYPLVTVVRGPGRGPAANRNAGAAAAAGEWLVFTDDDCIPDPDWLAAIARAVRRGGADVIEGRTVCRAGIPSPRWHAPVNESGGCLWSCNFAIRSELFRSMGGFDERFRFAHLEDVDLRERLRAAGAVVRFAPEAVVDHPPRRLAGPVDLGRQHESELLLERIHRGRSRFWGNLAAVAKTRARSIVKSRCGWDEKCRFALFSLIECLTFTVLAPVWLWRLRRRPQPWGAGEAANSVR